MNDVNQKISKTRLLLGFGLVFLSFASIFIYFNHKKYYPSTDDSYVKALLINVAPKINGTIKKVYVSNNQYVKAGTLLIELDPVDYETMIQQATLNILMAKKASISTRQQLSNAKASVVKAISNYNYSQQMAVRYTNLYKHKAGSQEAMQKFINDRNIAKEELDQAKVQSEQASIQYKMSKVKVDLAKVQLKNARLTNSYTKIYAPITSYVTDLNLQTGQVVMAGEKLFGLIDDNVWWVNANYKENQLTRIKTGQKATIELDMYDHKYEGVIQSISHASGNTFSLLPAENATGNWVKVSQRFTVKITIKNDPKYPLRVGASSLVTVDTRH